MRLGIRRSRENTLGPHPHVKERADLPVAARTTEHLNAVLAGLSDAQLEDRVAGFESMLAALPDDDETIRPTVETLRNVLVVELAVRARERRA